MESLAARRFAKTNETEFVQALPHLAGGLDDGRKGDVWPRIKIENEPARHLRLFWLAIPGMKLKGGGLRESRQAFDAIDLEIGFAVAGDGHEIKQIRCAQHGMALKELRTGKPAGRANDRTRAPLNMAKYPGSDFLVIMGEIKFGDRFAVARIGPKDLSGIGNQDAHDDRLPCFAGRGPCLRDS
jgi:hypothetical protein